jgi:23S rRNA (adenine-N6)-dimethyltransferase
MNNDLRFTQNFLHNKALVTRLVAAADLKPGDRVLEIGPGRGIITEALAARVGPQGYLTTVELDATFAARLAERFRDTPQVTVIAGDVLALDLTAAYADQHVFSNVPFNITSEILDLLFTRDRSPARAHLILQRDALISTSAYGDGETLKSLWIKPRYRVSVAHSFARSDFAPQPAVDTALFRFDRLDAPLIPPEQYALYKDFVAFVSKDRVGEGAWRKAYTGRGLKALEQSGQLIAGRGIKSQTAAAMVDAFRIFLTDPAKRGVVSGAHTALRQEQQQRDAITRAGGHHRSRGRPRR